VAASASPPLRVDGPLRDCVRDSPDRRGGIIALVRRHLRASPSLRQLSRSGAARPVGGAHHVGGPRKPGEILDGGRAATGDPTWGVSRERDARSPRPSIDHPAGSPRRRSGAGPPLDRPAPTAAAAARRSERRRVTYEPGDGLHTERVRLRRLTLRSVSPAARAPAVSGHRAGGAMTLAGSGSTPWRPLPPCRQASGSGRGRSNPRGQRRPAFGILMPIELRSYTSSQFARGIFNAQ
jgi:hypothetical protein